MKLIVTIAFAFWLLSTCAERHPASARFNVYFWFPNENKEYYLGVAQGLDHCGAMAWDFAKSKGLSSNSGWSHICCLKTASSECESKHR